MSHSSKKTAAAIPAAAGVNSRPNLEVDKDFAHYPPTPTKIVTRRLTKKLKETEKDNTDNSNNTEVAKGLPPQKERITNRTEKIVNDDGAGYSDGSARAFEATEQALE